MIDGEGSLYLPTEIALVYRHKTEIKRGVKLEMKWLDLGDVIA